MASGGSSVQSSLEEICGVESGNDDEIACPTCGKDSFGSVKGMKIHHAKAHGESIAGIEVECAWCGESKRAMPVHVEKNDRHFCDSECKAKWRSENWTGKDNPRWERIGVECAWCGEPKQVQPWETERNDHHFCNSACMGEWKSENLVGEASPGWRGGPIEVDCEWCGKTKEISPSVARGSDRYFCDQRCKGAWRSENWTGENHPRWSRVEVECAWCGVMEMVNVYDAEHKDHHFCSYECHGEWKSENLVGEASPGWRGGPVDVECATCGEPKTVPRGEYNRPGRERFFCDRMCLGDWIAENRTGKENPQWSRVEVECAWCGELDTSPKSHAERKDRHFCDYECMGKWRVENTSGENSPRWSGGGVSYYGPSFQPQRRRALDRSDGRCEACGLDRDAHRRLNDEDLHAHHKTPFKPVEGLFGHRIANSLSNLMMVCRSCHHQLEPVSRNRVEPFVFFATGLDRGDNPLPR